MNGENQSPSTVAPELLTLRQAAELCQVSPRTLWTWATTGISPPALRIGKGTTRYSRAAYVAWIQGGCRPMNGGPGDA
jgi:predicted DNA-binding transcriptional regulator AlpA